MRSRRRGAIEALLKTCFDETPPPPWVATEVSLRVQPLRKLAGTPESRPYSTVCETVFEKKRLTLEDDCEKLPFGVRMK